MRRIALMIAGLVMLLCGCGQAAETAAATTVAATTEVTTTTEPQTTEKVWPRNAEPLIEAEFIMDWASIDDLVKRFGMYESYDTMFYLEGSDCPVGHVQLEWPRVSVDLEFYNKKMSFGGKDEYWDFGKRKDVKLTAKDKATKGYVFTMRWSDPAITGPRDIKIGDSAEAVFGKYLDLREKHKGESRDYEWGDEDEFIYNYHLSDDITEEELYHCDKDVYAYVRHYEENEGFDYTIHYEANTWLEFDIKDGKVARISQGNYNWC